MFSIVGCWLAGCCSQMGGTRLGEGNELVPRAHSYIQMAAARIQETGYRILHPTRGYRIQDTACSTAKIQ